MFSTERMPDEDQGDFFQVSRRFFRRAQKGGQWILAPLAEGAHLAVGDQLEVQISLRTKHEAEYVHLRDPRPAGLEPENAVSKWKWDLGIAWYEEPLPQTGYGKRKQLETAAKHGLQHNSPGVPY